MERIRAILSIAKKNPVTAIRYIIVGAGVFVTFTNLFDCIIKSKPFHTYFLYVGVLGLLVFLTAIVNHNGMVCFVLSTVGLLAIIDSGSPTTLGIGILWLVFAKRIADNLLFSVLIYFVTALTIIASQVMAGNSPSDGINLIVGAYALFFMDYLLDGKTN